MSYLKNLFKSLKIIIITSILPYIITIISSIIYIKITRKSINYFINNYLIYISIITYLFIIIFLIKKYKITTKKLAINKYYSYISLGISISCIFNMLLFIITKPTPNIKVPLILLFISTSIIGPIYEELVFRYIFYNKLKEFNSTNKSILITTTIFSLIHINIFKIIYAFILGLILNITYEKNKNILSSILLHIAANTTSLLLTNYSTIVLILSIILLLISLKVAKYHS